jgi:hypothetical protein
LGIHALGSTWMQGPELMGGWESESVLSSDGDTALIEYRTPCYCLGHGGALVFTRSGSAWAQQGPELTSGEDVFESDAALSGDGNTALITDYTHPGVLVFTRSGSTWTQQSRRSRAAEKVAAVVAPPAPRQTMWPCPACPNRAGRYDGVRESAPQVARCLQPIGRGCSLA